jgi:hypothetical protein
MKDKLCKAFCDDLAVHSLPSGVTAVSTAFIGPDNDPIGFYVVKNENTGRFRIEDDGRTLPTLEASGVDFRSGTRGDALTDLLGEYGVRLDDDTLEFGIDGLTEDAIPAAAMKFVAFSLRVRDFLLMTEFRVASTFREDAKRLLSQAVGDRATMSENAVISPTLSDFPADFVLRAPSRPPVAVYLGTSEARILEALFMQMRARYEVREECAVIALLERAQRISAKVRQQATNRLAAVTEFRGDEAAAIQRIVLEATGTPDVIH